jgi:hypothetical protein
LAAQVSRSQFGISLQLQSARRTLKAVGRNWLPNDHDVVFMFYPLCTERFTLYRRLRSASRALRAVVACVSQFIRFTFCILGCGCSFFFASCLEDSSMSSYRLPNTVRNLSLCCF